MDQPVPVTQSEPGTDGESVISGTDSVGGDPFQDSPFAPANPQPQAGDLASEVAALSRRVDALAVSFEGTVRQAVAEEVQRVAGELQHTVTALGRILVRDLGKLNQILGEHRDTIVAELRKTSAGGAQTDEEASVAVDEGTAGGPAGPERPVKAGRTGPDDDDPGGVDQKSVASRQWRARRRKA